VEPDVDPDASKAQEPPERFACSQCGRDFSSSVGFITHTCDWNHALHAAWTWAVGKPGYDKAMWRNLEGQIVRLIRARDTERELRIRAEERVRELERG